jgi:hypothetical protein
VRPLSGIETFPVFSDRGSLSSNPFIPAELRYINKKYLEKSGKNLLDILDSEFSGDLLKLYRTVTISLLNPVAYFSRRIREACKGLGTNDHLLIRILVTRDEIDLKEIDRYYKENYNTCIEKLLSYSKNISEITITTAFEEMDGKKMDVNNPLFSLYIQCIQRYACLQHDDHLTLAILKLNDEKIQEDFIKNELVIQWDNKIFAVFPKNIIIQIATENNIVISSEYYNNPDLYKKIDNNSNKEKTDNIKEINKEKN